MAASPAAAARTAPATMTALVNDRRLPTSAPGCFVEREVPTPQLRPRDVLVEVRAVSVPADVRRRGAVGAVGAVGSEVRHHAPGDDVFHAGDVTRMAFATPDLGRQRQILNQVADLFDDGILVSTPTTILEGSTAEDLARAHRISEANRSVGKTVITR